MRNCTEGNADQLLKKKLTSGTTPFVPTETLSPPLTGGPHLSDAAIGIGRNGDDNVAAEDLRWSSGRRHAEILDFRSAAGAAEFDGTPFEIARRAAMKLGIIRF